MKLDDYINTLEQEGERFAAAAAERPLDTPVPTCPAWSIRDLMQHLGTVHRWATTVVAGAIPKPSAVPQDFAGSMPADVSLHDWYRDGHAALVATLRSTDPDTACFTFLADPPPPLTFWARRQAHETSMHRLDAELATTVTTPFETELAADGIDEILTGFAPRKYTPLHSDRPTTLQVVPVDADGVWTMTISADAPATVRAAQDADCTVRGHASDLLRALWNRADVAALTIDGDPAVLAMFRDSVKVQWS